MIQDARNSQEVRRALYLLSPLPVAWPAEAHCTRALSDFSALHLSHGPGLLDALIAATEIGHGATLSTFNVNHYRAINGLSMLQPYDR